MASRRKEWESIQGALSTSRFQRPNRSARTCLPASGSAVRSGTVATIRDLLLLAVILGDTVGLKMEAAAATPKMSTLRLLLALAAQHDLDITCAMLFKCAFLNSGLVDSNCDPLEIWVWRSTWSTPRGLSALPGAASLSFKRASTASSRPVATAAIYCDLGSSLNASAAHHLMHVGFRRLLPMVALNMCCCGSTTSHGRSS